MRIVKLTEESKSELLDILQKRSPASYTEYENTVNDIISNVRENGDKALFEYTEKFDKCVITKDTIKVTREEIDEAYKKLDPEFIEVMKKSAANIREFHEKQKRESWFTTKPDGSILGHIRRICSRRKSSIS